jgi:hypothetical protein
MYTCQSNRHRHCLESAHRSTATLLDVASHVHMLRMTIRKTADALHPIHRVAPHLVNRLGTISMSASQGRNLEGRHMDAHLDSVQPASGSHAMPLLRRASPQRRGAVAAATSCSEENETTATADGTSMSRRGVHSATTSEARADERDAVENAVQTHG